MDRRQNYTVSRRALREDYIHAFGLRPPGTFTYDDEGTQLQQYGLLKDLRTEYDREFYNDIWLDDSRQTQIVHVSGNHWILVSNVHDEGPNVIHIFDSIGKTKLTDVVVHLVAAVFRFPPEFPKFFIRQKNVDKQPNGKDCGIRAIGMAEAICMGTESQTITFASSQVINWKQCTRPSVVITLLRFRLCESI